MIPLCILFAHHCNDAVTRRHLDILRQNNSDPIIPVCNGAKDHVDGAVDVWRFSKRFETEHPWTRGDVMLYLWFRHFRSIEAERYAYIEWDTLATMPLRDYYSEVWDAPAAASQVKLPQATPQWEWFRPHRSSLPLRLTPFATGLAPLNAVLLSRNALKTVSDSQIPRNVFSELRLGTLLRFNGISAVPFTVSKAATNEWKPNLIKLASAPGVYHPVKANE